MLQHWKGINANSSNNILILGESHYGDEVGKNLPQNKTATVVQNYLDYKNSYLYKESGKGESHRWASFFTRIAASFGCVEYEEIWRFYEGVLFANYIDKYCGIKDSSATSFLKNSTYREHCNNELFRLVNAENIRTIICFSRRVYNKLPSLSTSGESEKTYIPVSGKKVDRVDICKYNAGATHDNCTTILRDNLVVYGYKHPSSGGFSANNFLKFIKNGNFYTDINDIEGIDAMTN